MTGLADALIMLGLRYDHRAGRNVAAVMLRTIRNAAYCGSVQLALERGAFPLFEAHRLLSPPHAASRLPWFIRRRITMPDGSEIMRSVDDHALRRLRALRPDSTALPEAWCDASTLSAVDHLRMVAALQPFVDAGISKTVHLQETASVQDLDRLLRSAWRSGLKGVSVFRGNALHRDVLCDARRSTR